MALSNRSFRSASALVVVEEFESRMFLSVSALDPNFGTGGKIVSNIPHTGNVGAVVDTYGRILSYDGNALVRYKAAGKLDSSFGNGGELVLKAAISGDGVPGISGFALQNDGKIVITWNESNPGGASQHSSLPASNGAYVARLNANGAFDSTFGSKGIVSLASIPSDPYRPLETVGIGVASSGKIVVGGDDGFEAEALQAVRLNSNGTRDNSFGTKGLASIPYYNPLDGSADSIDVQTDGKVIVVGAFGTLVRFTAAGIPDPTFGSSGISHESGPVSQIYGSTLQANNQLVVAGEQNTAGDGAAYVERFKTNGAVDATFGLNGFVLTSFVPNEASYGVGIAVQHDGKMVVVGYAFDPFTDYSNFAVARYLPNGSPDATFGTHGVVITGFGDDSPALASAVAIQSSGRLVVAGSSGIGSVAPSLGTPAPFLTLVRYLGNHAVITGGESQVTTGASVAADPRLAGSVVGAQTLNFAYGTGAAAVHGQVQEWVEKETVGGTLDFYFRVVTSGGSVAGISSLIASNFAGYTTYVDYRPDSTGTIAPVTAGRSGDSKAVTFNFLAGPSGNGLVTAGTSSYALLIKTDATKFNKLGKVLLNNVISLDGYEPA